MRAPRWVSPRRQIEKVLSELLHLRQKKPSFSSSLLDIHILHAQVAKRGLLPLHSIHTSLIKAYARHCLTAALNLFDEMPLKQTFSCNLILSSALIRSGDLRTAGKLFDTMRHKYLPHSNTPLHAMQASNSVACAVTISGYVRAVLEAESIASFDRLAAESYLTPAVVTILAACAHSGLLGFGKIIHGWILRIGLDFTTKVCNALLHMYAKCGHLDGAWNVFESMDRPDRVSWNSIIHSLAVHGHGEIALSLIDIMMDDGICPDGVTFVAILCACVHLGLIEEGRHFFASMEKAHGISPQVEHYGCMVDLFGRGGLLDEAFQLVCSMPFEPGAVIYGSLLSSCRKFGNAGMAEVVLEKLMRVDSSFDSGVYATMSNIYASAKCWDGMAKMRSKMKGGKVRKPSGYSYIEIENVLHGFTVAEKSHPQMTRIMQMVETLCFDMSEAGFLDVIGNSLG